MSYGDEFEYTGPRQPTTAVGSTARARGRLSTEKTNSLKQPATFLELELTADNEFVPVLYGEKSIPARVSAYVEESGALYYRVTWCMGEVWQVDQLYVNGRPIEDYAGGGDIQVHHYRGTAYQAPDSYMEEAVAGYDDALLLLRPEGVTGVAYSVIKVNSGDVTMFGGVPRFQARIRGRLVWDVRRSTVGDPFQRELGYNFLFTGDNGTQPSNIDKGPHNLSPTWVGTSEIENDKLRLNAAGDYVSASAGGSAIPSSTKWTIECRFQPANVGSVTLRYVFGYGNGSSNRCIALGHLGDDLKVYLSSNGTSWNMLSGVTINSGSPLLAGVDYLFAAEFDGLGYTFYLEGREGYYHASTTALNATDATWYLGRLGGVADSSTFRGLITGFRLLNDYNRYGGQHNAAPTPYPNNIDDQSGYGYDDLSVLCLAELAFNPFYGLGIAPSDLPGLTDCVEWNEEEIATGVDRARLSLLLSEPKSTSEYMDLLATYAECFWVPEGDSITLSPDRQVDAKNRQGWYMGENQTFDGNADGWTLGTGWAYSVFFAMTKAAGTASDLSQTLGITFEAGVEYALKLVVTGIATGAVDVKLGGVSLLDDVDTAGTYYKTFTATGAETGTTLAVEADATVAAYITECSIRRMYWKDQGAMIETLERKGFSDLDSPTKVYLSYTQPSDTLPDWQTILFDEAEMPDVSTGALPLVEASLQMEGVYREEEASVKAFSKLYRMQDRVEYTWVTADRGILYQKGLVVQLPDNQYGRELVVLVTTVKLVSYGRYRVVGILYSESHYAGQVVDPVGGYGYVPAGAIAPLIGTTAPDGFSIYSDADGSNIKLTDGSGALTIGDMGGNNSVTINTATDAGTSAHGYSIDTFWINAWDGSGSTGSGVRLRVYDPNITNGSHTHTISLVDQFVGHLRRRNILVRADADTNMVPSAVRVFGLLGLTAENLSQALQFGGRTLQANDENNLAGVYSRTETVTTDSKEVDHTHIDLRVVGNAPTALNFTPTYYDYETEVSAHAHSVPLLLTPSLKRVVVPLYQGTQDYRVVQGVIFLWAGSLVSVPEDFTLCNGKLGTPSVEDDFLVMDGEGLPVRNAGNNTVTATATSYNAGSHTHRGAAYSGSTDNVTEVEHSSDHVHSHSVSISVAYEPVYYVLAAIMYNPMPSSGWVDATLLLNANEAEGVTTIVDNSPLAAPPASSQATVEYDDALQVFSINSLRAVSGGALAYSSVIRDLKFTTEAFVSIHSVDEQDGWLMGNRGTSTAIDEDRWALKWNSSTSAFDFYVDNAVQFSSQAYSTDTWLYVAVQYDGSSWKVYCGTQASGVASVAGQYITAVTAHTASTLYLFNKDSDTSTESLNCNVAEVQHTNGAAKYAGAAIQTPSSSYPTE